ncbi:MAG: hypothetical protein JXD18_06970 [Anaerolineae bacterium]|nr:hypothetical protein [Anaerolineae bacterium]
MRARNHSPLLAGAVDGARWGCGSGAIYGAGAGVLYGAQHGPLAGLVSGGVTGAVNGALVGAAAGAVCSVLTVVAAEHVPAQKAGRIFFDAFAGGLSGIAAGAVLMLRDGLVVGAMGSLAFGAAIGALVGAILGTGRRDSP